MRTVNFVSWFKRPIVSATMLALLFFVAGTPADAKVPGKTYCYNGICHYVKTLKETQREVGRKQWVTASYYDDAKRDKYNPSNITSSGEYFRSWTPDNAASPNLPNGTKVLVWYPGTKKSVVVRINNSGPYYGNRTLDLSRAAAERIGLNTSGTKGVQMAVLYAPTPDEARYKRGRTYSSTSGYIGWYKSFDTAIASAGGSTTSTRYAAAPTTRTVGGKPKR